MKKELPSIVPHHIAVGETSFSRQEAFRIPAQPISEGEKGYHIRERRLEDIILVGLSFGGTVVQKLAEELPDRIARLVFLDALIVKDGHCVFDVLPSEYAALFNDLARASS